MSLVPMLFAAGTVAVTASVDPPYVFGSKSGPGPATSQVATVTVMSGVAPFTYAWSYDSGDAGFTANTSTSASTSFNKTVANGDYFQAVWKCIVTDARSNVSAPVYVTVSASEISINYD